MRESALPLLRACARQGCPSTWQQCRDVALGDLFFSNAARALEFFEAFLLLLELALKAGDLAVADLCRAREVYDASAPSASMRKALELFFD
jgi:hypothetical protein